MLTVPGDATEETQEGVEVAPNPASHICDQRSYQPMR